ncbi:MAG: thioredoxin [Algibacter sp.]|uniref:thioredoxin n=1 Tax=Algibacter sp. TaxID=1872428 RepID=UPI0026049022|nr:thioredoxin [Algibacter sp.]MDG1730376.1 thioredoxin [Algibacter sp.]MDG2178854.1 thioredoxin [Algibacter sp.]
MKTNFNTIIQSEIPVLIDFHANWCGPCKTLAPILKEVKETLEDAIKIIKIDVDKNQPLAAKYQVRGVPTMLLFKNGKQVWRQSGVLQKNDIISIIKKHT